MHNFWIDESNKNKRLKIIKGIQGVANGDFSNANYFIDYVVESATKLAKRYKIDDMDEAVDDCLKICFEKAKVIECHPSYLMLSYFKTVIVSYLGQVYRRKLMLEEAD